MGLPHTVKNLINSYVLYFPSLAERIKKKTFLVVLLVIALIFFVIGVGLWIASAVLVYSKSIATSHE